MRSSAALLGTFACVLLNLPPAPGAASAYYCGGASLPADWVPPWLPRPGPGRHDLACHLMAGCRREAGDDGD
ncbi:hypothetical protein J3E64_002851 [Sphingobium sp. OAS761]|uniref:hypothetical protein n=1 Tax=Sphingobium sp. OAS761 TaxID=2817901 RepID=UPI0020A2284C|nr:hypothetical protein [Sphingobium sp. OAS761]MCP1471147.1 hypothetical protein [Sphingobium sp. OAS761]